MVAASANDGERLMSKQQRRGGMKNLTWLAPGEIVVRIPAGIVQFMRSRVRSDSEWSV